MPFVDQVANGLADEVGGNRVARQAVLSQQRPFFRHVIWFRQRAIHFEMVAPAGEFHAVVAHLFGERGEFWQRQIGPLAGEKGDSPRHRMAGSSLRGIVRQNRKNCV